MDKLIGLKELRENINVYTEGVKKGKSYIVLRKSKPLFKLVPIDKESGEWEEVVDFTKIRKGGVNVKDILNRL